jgi:hypothetical protein
MVAKGRLSHGEHHATKLTADDVQAIRLRLAAGERQATIARDYSVHQVMISKIKTGRSWSRTGAAS